MAPKRNAAKRKPGTGDKKGKDDKQSQRSRSTKRTADDINKDDEDDKDDEGNEPPSKRKKTAARPVAGSSKAAAKSKKPVDELKYDSWRNTTWDKEGNVTSKDGRPVVKHSEDIDDTDDGPTAKAKPKPKAKLPKASKKTVVYISSDSSDNDKPSAKPTANPKKSPPKRNTEQQKAKPKQSPPKKRAEPNDDDSTKSYSSASENDTDEWLIVKLTARLKACRDHKRTTTKGKGKAESDDSEEDRKLIGELEFRLSDRQGEIDRLLGPRNRKKNLTSTQGTGQYDQDAMHWFVTPNPPEAEEEDSAPQPQVQTPEDEDRSPPFKHLA